MISFWLNRKMNTAHCAFIVIITGSTIYTKLVLCKVRKMARAVVITCFTSFTMFMLTAVTTIPPRFYPKTARKIWQIWKKKLKPNLTKSLIKILQWYSIQKLLSFQAFSYKFIDWKILSKTLDFYRDQMVYKNQTFKFLMNDM